MRFALRAAATLWPGAAQVQMGREQTDSEYLLAVNLGQQYDICQNLAFIVQAGWSHGESLRSVRGRRLVNQARNGGPVKVAFGLKYQFQVRALGAHRRSDIMDSATLPVIGVIRTPFVTLEDIPRQSRLALDVTGRAEITPEYAPGLRDLEVCSKVYLYYLFHGVTDVELVTRSRREGREMGVFATRSPRRPSRLGVSLVDVASVEPGALVFTGVDMLDGSPLLDIKPWISGEAD